MRDSSAVGLVDELAEKIQMQILRGEIPVGVHLRQEQLAETFGVSRTPVREALRKLQTSGLIELHSRRGALVHLPTGRDVRDAYRVRAHLEGLAAALAAQWRNDEQVVRLRQAEVQFEQSVVRFVTDKGAGTKGVSEESGWIAANDLFHEVVHEASGNDFLRTTIANIHTRFPRRLTWGALAADSRLLRNNAVQHQEIRAAIEAGETEQAARLMREHVEASGILVANRLERASQ
jgi:DNA-binding GntR family transcriptional regulator